MKKKKYYFQKPDEACYKLQYHLDFMKENNLQELEVFEAKVERGSGYFFCREFNNVGETKENCGKFNCVRYKPRNGKSGICTHYGYLYEQGKSVILKCERK